MNPVLAMLIAALAFAGPPSGLAADANGISCKVASAAQPAVPPDTPTEAYGDHRPDCLQWSDGCRVCSKLPDGSQACSNVGIACVAREPACLSTRPTAELICTRSHDSKCIEITKQSETSAATLEIKTADGGILSRTGSVSWKVITLNTAKDTPAEIAVGADVVIEDIEVALTLRRNRDQTLPASHVVEIVIGGTKPLPYGGLRQIPGVVTQSDQMGSARKLEVLSVQVTDRFFMMGLSGEPRDRLINIGLLKTANNFKLPLVYRNGERGILKIDKGAGGEHVFNQVLAAWQSH